MSRVKIPPFGGSARFRSGVQCANRFFRVSGFTYLRRAAAAISRRRKRVYNLGLPILRLIC
jgi:hypothetical protein